MFSIYNSYIQKKRGKNAFRDQVREKMLLFYVTFYCVMAEKNTIIDSLYFPKLVETYSTNPSSLPKLFLLPHMII